MMDCADALKALQEIEQMPGTFRKGWSIPAAFLCAAGFAALRPSSGAMTAKNVNAAEQE